MKICNLLLKSALAVVAIKAIELLRDIGASAPSEISGARAVGLLKIARRRGVV